MNDFATGITLTWMGISITFLALFVLILLIVTLRAVFPFKAVIADDEKQPEADSINGTVAIAAAWWYLQQKKKSTALGQVLEQPPGPWRNSSRKKHHRK
ncbi:MAG: OadG family protein [Chloroflexota bacterium]